MNEAFQQQIQNQVLKSILMLRSGDLNDLKIFLKQYRSDVFFYTMCQYEPVQQILRFYLRSHYLQKYKRFLTSHLLQQNMDKIQDSEILELENEIYEIQYFKQNQKREKPIQEKKVQSSFNIILTIPLIIHQTIQAKLHQYQSQLKSILNEWQNSHLTLNKDNFIFLNFITINIQKQIYNSLQNYISSKDLISIYDQICGCINLFEQFNIKDHLTLQNIKQIIQYCAQTFKMITNSFQRVAKKLIIFQKQQYELAKLQDKQLKEIMQQEDIKLQIAKVSYIYDFYEIIKEQFEDQYDQHMKRLLIKIVITYFKELSYYIKSNKVKFSTLGCKLFLQEVNSFLQNIFYFKGIRNCFKTNKAILYNKYIRFIQNLIAINLANSKSLFQFNMDFGQGFQDDEFKFYLQHKINKKEQDNINHLTENLLNDHILMVLFLNDFKKKKKKDEEEENFQKENK